MRASRMVVIVAAVFLLGACASGGLTTEERSWCQQNENPVLNAFGTLYAGDPIMDTITDQFVAALSGGVESLSEFLQQTYPSQYEESCRRALAER